MSSHNLIDIASKIFVPINGNLNNKNFLMFETSDDNVQVFETLLNISFYGFIFLKLDPNYLDDQVVEYFNSYFQSTGYKLKYNTAHEYSVTFCQIMVDVSHDLDATSDKLFYPNKFHPLFLYNNDHHEHPKIVTDYFNNKKLLHNLSCLTQNGKYTLSFILSP